MKLESSWQPSKFRQRRDGTWRGSRDPADLAPASRIYADRSVQRYQEALTRYARGDLADLGCGRVPLYGIYRDLVDSVTCADWPNTINPSPHLDHEIDLSQPFDVLADDSFDTVLLTDVLEHLPSPQEALREIDRVLRPGGVLLIGVPFLYTIHEVPYDFHRYTEYLLRLRLEELGHEVLEVHQFGGPAEVVFDVVAKVMSAGGAPRPLVSAEQAVGGLVGRMLPERARRRADALMPSGYLVVSRSSSAARRA